MFPWKIDMLNFADIISVLSPFRPGSIDKKITQAVVDSRQAVVDSLFVAIRGKNVDGHDFVANAFLNGAAAALIERPLSDPTIEALTIDLRTTVREELVELVRQTEMPVCFLVNNTVEALQRLAAFVRQRSTAKVIGVTGSFGKTTTKEAIARVLRKAYITQKSEGNHNNEIGLPLSLIGLKPETEVMVLEMGFYVPGEIKLLCDIAKPSIGVLTNIGAVHAERAGSLEMIAKGKGELVEELPTAPDGIAILNHDDWFIREFDQRTNARVFRYGTTPECDLWVDSVKGLGLDGIECRLHFGTGTILFRSPLLGEHSIYTILRAAAVGLVMGISLPTITEALSERSEQLRLTPKKLANGTLIIDDSYNAGPDSTAAALRLLKDVPGRHIAVLGDMLELGQYEREGHEMVGKTARECADELFTFGDRALTIASKARELGMKHVRSFSNEQIDLLVANLVSRVTGDEVILVKGSFSMGMNRVVKALESIL